MTTEELQESWSTWSAWHNFAPWAETYELERNVRFRAAVYALNSGALKVGEWTVLRNLLMGYASAPSYHDSSGLWWQRIADAVPGWDALVIETDAAMSPQDEEEVEG